MAATQQVKPGKAGIWIGILLMVLSLGSCVGGVVLAGAEVADAIDGAEKTPVGTDVQYTFGENAKGIILGFGPSQSAADDVDATLVGPDGNEVKIDRSASFPSGTEASANDDSLSLIGTFEATDAGDYILSTSGPDGSSAAILKLSFSSVLTKIFGGLGIGFLMFLIGLILLIVTVVRRGKAKKRLAASGGFVPPPSMGGAPPAPGMAPGMAPSAPGMAPPMPGMAPPAPGQWGNEAPPPAPGQWGNDAPAAPPAAPPAPPAPPAWSPEAPPAPPAPASPPPPPAQWGTDTPPPPPPFGS